MAPSIWLPAYGRPLSRASKATWSAFLVPLQPWRWVVSLLQTIGVAVHQAPFVLEPENVRDAVRPLHRLVHALHAHAERLNVGRVGELRRGHRRHVPVADGTALELRPRPVPAHRHRIPSFFIAAPAVEARRIVAVGIERLD